MIWVMNGFAILTFCGIHNGVGLYVLLMYLSWLIVHEPSTQLN
jgi:hypothetical protein